MESLQTKGMLDASSAVHRCMVACRWAAGKAVEAAWLSTSTHSACSLLLSTCLQMVHEHTGQSTVLNCTALWVCGGGAGLATACTCCQRRSPMLHTSSSSHAWVLLRRWPHPHGVQHQHS